MKYFAHAGHDHSEDMTHASSSDPLATVIIIVLVVGAVVALAAFIRSRKNR